MKFKSFFLFSGLAVLLVLMSFTFSNQNSIEENPVKITVIYGHPDDPVAFEKYYQNEHSRLAEKMKGVSRIELTKFEHEASGEKPAHYRMAELYFPNVEAMQKALDSPEAKATVEDISNFATGGATMLIGTAENFPLLD